MGDEEDVYGGYNNSGYDPAMDAGYAYNPNDPVSMYYQPPSWSDANYISPGDVPSGGGAYSSDGGENWNTIYAPGGGTDLTNYGRAGYGFVNGGDTALTGRPSYSPDMNFDLFAPGRAGGGRGPMGGGGGQPPQRQVSPGMQAVANRQPDLISLGKPDTELYNRYKSLLLNPDFSNDPTYKFLFNQGQQALNRSLAAKRMLYSGNAMDDTIKYGAGMASKYMQDLIPQYRGGAQEELSRFMGPAGLLPEYARSNNMAIQGANNQVNNAQDTNYMRNLMANDPGMDLSGFSSPAGNNIGWGGRTQMTEQAPQRWGAGQPRPQPLSGGYDAYYQPYSGNYPATADTSSIDEILAQDPSMSGVEGPW